MDQNQAVQENPGAEPQQSEHQRPPTGPHAEAQPPEQAEPPGPSPSAGQQPSREHGGGADGPHAAVLLL